MAARTGIAAQFGCAAETTVGTAVTVTTFLPLVSESIQRTEAFTESAGIRAGRQVMISEQQNSGSVTVGGDVQLELPTLGPRPLFKAMWGTETGSGPWTYTPGDLAGNSLTVQIGRPGVDGTVRPFTYPGCKVASWEIACAAGEIAQLGVTFMGSVADETTGIALASASYTSGLKAFKFSGATVTVAGTAVSAKQLTITGDNGLEERRFLGSLFSKEQLQTGLMSITGSIQAEFTDLTLYNLYKLHTEAAIVATFVSGTQQLVITMNARIDGETPNVGGTGVVEQAIPFTCLATAGGGADSTAFSAVYTAS